MVKLHILRAVKLNPEGDIQHSSLMACRQPSDKFSKAIERITSHHVVQLLLKSLRTIYCVSIAKTLNACSLFPALSVTHGYVMLVNETAITM